MEGERRNCAAEQRGKEQGGKSLICLRELKKSPAATPACLSICMYGGRGSGTSGAATLTHSLSEILDPHMTASYQS